MARVLDYAGPVKALKVDGRFVVTVYFRPENEELPAAYVARLLGWGHQIVAECRGKATLLAYLERRFPGCSIAEG